MTTSDSDGLSSQAGQGSSPARRASPRFDVFPSHNRRDKPAVERLGERRNPRAARGENSTAYGTEGA